MEGFQRICYINEKVTDRPLRRVFCFPGQNGALNMFSKHHDVLSKVSKISTNHFFNFNINYCVFMLKKVNYAIFFEVVLIIFSVSF